jgi:PRTRC genetic system protein B
MEAHVQIVASANLHLRHAMLVYTDQQRAFATLHDIVTQPEGAPLLAPAQPLSLAFLRRLAEGLGNQVAPEVLPENVMARTPEMIVWWSPAARRIMFFGEADEEAGRLNGLNFPHPPLVFKVGGRELFVRALGKNTRPRVDAPLKTAPYWNTAGDDGRVCLGSTHAPESTSVESIKSWEAAFFQSSFTHALGAVRLTSHKQGFIGLWRSLAGKKVFPVRYLTDTRETLREFVARER